jgi:hypothetical protein
MEKPTYPCVVHCRRQRFDVYIGRPSKWGNPIRITIYRNREQVIQDYRQWLNGDKDLVQLYGPPPTTEEIIRELRGKVLGCWCTPKPCHGDVLLEIANSKI